MVGAGRPKPQRDSRLRAVSRRQRARCNLERHIKTAMEVPYGASVQVEVRGNSRWNEERPRELIAERLLRGRIPNGSSGFSSSTLVEQRVRDLVSDPESQPVTLDTRSDSRPNMRPATRRRRVNGDRERVLGQRHEEGLPQSSGRAQLRLDYLEAAESQDRHEVE
jgi:hypothetical protein